MSDQRNTLPRILVIGYHKFAQLMNTVMAEFRERADIRIVEHVVASEFDVAELVARHAADIVVSAGANGAYLAATLEVPVLTLQVSDRDVIEAVLKASKLSRRMLLIGYGSGFAVLDSLRVPLDLDIEQRCYQTADEAREQFLMASRAGVEVVIGASLTCELAERSGIPAILLYSRESCRALLEQALARVEALDIEQRRAAWHAALLQDPQLPTVLLDADGRLDSWNQTAARHFGLDNGGRSELQRLLDAGTGATVYMDEQRWHLHRSVAVAGRQHVGQVLRFLPESVQPGMRARSSNQSRKLVFASAEMQQIDRLIGVYAATPGTVLIQGESGTGKELVAQRLYRESAYAGGEMVAINCGAIPEELFESELFGHVEGAFTSSRRGGRRGLLEQANHGVMFLDEVSEMPLGQQAKLLRVLEERRMRPLGSNREVHLDLKLVAATNCDLRERVRQGLFREDLFYRLNVFSLYLPPLRERTRDIPGIARYLLEEYALRQAVKVDVDAVLALVGESFMRYRWRGNVRELENFIERIVVTWAQVGSGEELRVALPHVLPELWGKHGNDMDEEGSGALRDQERNLIQDAMRRFDNDKTRVAEFLGISQTTLWRRLKQTNGS